MLFLLTNCKPTNDQLFDKAFRLINEKQYAAAIPVYNEIILRNKKLQLAFYNRGVCYTNLKEYSKALADFNQVINLHTIEGGGDIHVDQQ